MAILSGPAEARGGGKASPANGHVEITLPKSFGKILDSSAENGKPRKKRKARRQKQICSQRASIPIPHAHRCEHSAGVQAANTSDRAMAADSILSNYLGGGAALAALAITMLALCTGSVCRAMGYVNLALTAAFLIIAVAHYFLSIDGFYRSHSYHGNKAAAVLILVQALATIVLIVAQFNGEGV